MVVLLVANLIRPVSAMVKNDHQLWQECRSEERRITCVVDGDTLWYQGTKICLLDIDAPEVEGRCTKERQRAQSATLELNRLLNTGFIRITYDGQVKYCRHFARIWVGEGEIGAAMLTVGLAKSFGQRGPSPWSR